MGAKSEAKFHGQPGDFAGQCEATSKTSKKRCRQHAKPGANTCEFHGSAAPQVKKAARERLAALVSPAIAKLQSTLNAKKNDKHISPQLQLAAARDVLDRNGLKAKDEIVVHSELDVSKFAEFTDEELVTFIALARRASTHKPIEDAAEAPE